MVCTKQSHISICHYPICCIALSLVANSFLLFIVFVLILYRYFFLFDHARLIMLTLVTCHFLVLVNSVIHSTFI